MLNTHTRLKAEDIATRGALDGHFLYANLGLIAHYLSQPLLSGWMVTSWIWADEPTVETVPLISISPEGKPEVLETDGLVGTVCADHYLVWHPSQRINGVAATAHGMEARLRQMLRD